MSSTTDQGNERGQIIVLFAGGLVAIILIAALVFDVGHDLLERRHQQNVADSAALAGARFLTTAGCKAGNSIGACPEAVQAARDLATRNGYTDGLNGAEVRINIPPNGESKFAGVKGHIQVVIDTDRDAFFTGIIGWVTHRVATLAVAGNIDQYSIPFALLSLNDSACNAGQIQGNGTIYIDADIMVNSTCSSSGALVFGGNGVTVDVPNCLVNGTWQINGSPIVNCSIQERVTPQYFPAIPGPQPQPLAAPPIITGPGSNTPPKGCPGSSSPATQTNPAACRLEFNQPKTVRIFPGMYPGGLQLRETSDDLTVYVEPGIYYIGGGGLEISGGLVLTTVEQTGDTCPTSTTCGVLIYNTDDPSYMSQCQAGTAPGAACIKAIDFQNTTGGRVYIRGYQLSTVFRNLVIFQDPDASAQPAMSVEGNSSMTIIGTIYLPEADFSYNGNGTGEVLNAQVISDEFDITGNGSLAILYKEGDTYRFRGIGLVQ